MFDYILRICYPVNYPNRLQSLSMLEKALTAALKYDIERAIEFLKEDFVRLGSEDPAWMYMVACRLDLEQDAQTAADLLRAKYYPQRPKNLPPLSGGPTDADFARIAVEVYRKGFEELPAIHLYQLLRHICFDTPVSFKDRSSTQSKRIRADAPPPADPKFMIPDTMSSLLPDVFLQSIDGQNIPVHKVVLRLVAAKPILQELESGNCPRPNGTPVVSLYHPARTLIPLLKACYLTVNPNSPSDDDYDLYSVAKCYGMHGIADMLKARWLLHAHITKRPLSVYLLASSNGWKHDAWQAVHRLGAYSTSNSSIFNSMYCEEMKMVGTIGHYYRLLKHLHVAHRVENMAL